MKPLLSFRKIHTGLIGIYMLEPYGHFSRKMAQNTVKHRISAVSNFRGMMKITYWRIFILALIIYLGSK